jgi:hypothetical protein
LYYIIFDQALIIVFIFFRLSEKFKKHLTEKWPDIVVSALLVLLGSSIAVTGIYWTLQNQADSFYYNQLDSFKRCFPAVLNETAGNQALIKTLKEKISPINFSVRRIYTSVSESLYANPLLYKYVGEEYLTALGIYLDRARTTNQVLDHFADEFGQGKRLSDNDIAIMQSNLDLLLHYLYILEYQSQYYIYLYGDEGQLKPGNQQQIMRWLLKEEEITPDGIKQKLYELANISPEDKEKLLKSTADVWIKVRNRKRSK